MRNDIVVITANSVSVCLLLGILGFKIRELLNRGHRRS
jgi:hypothetical protein